MREAVADSELIPLETYFSAESYDGLQLSPDGSLLSFVGPRGSVASLFVAPVDDLDAARPVTLDEVRGIQPRDVSGNLLIRWSTCGKYLLFPRDRNGDERWQLHRVDVHGGGELNLTPFDGARAELVALSPRHPGEVLVSIDDRQPGVGDLYRIDLASGERRLVEENPGFLGYLADADFRPRVTARLGEAGSIALLKSSGDGSWAPLTEIPAEDVPALLSSIYQRILRLDEDGSAVYLYDSRGRDTGALVRLELETGQTTLVAEDARVDIAAVLYHPAEGRPQAYATMYRRKRWHVLDDAISDDMVFLRDALDGDLSIVSRDSADRKWVVEYTVSDQPEEYHLYDRGERKLRKLMVTTPELEGIEMMPMHPVVVKSRDGFDLVSYLTLPLGSDPDASGRPEHPVPLVLIVHGGPSDERAQYGYGPFVQWLASRGYGSLCVNYRGSPGFGKSFMNAARYEWGGKMHDDLLDQVEWAIAEGITARESVAIIGGSYGGYATLVAMTMTPEVFACGVDLVGPSSIEKPMPHWTEESMAQSMGDPRTEEGRAHLAARSPINFAHQTKHPILIGQGANDARVPQEQSDQMVDVMLKQGAGVVYALYPDEGHGLLRAENNRSFWAITEIFLARCLGGRYRPIENELEGSSVEVPVGAEHIPGLEEALARRRSAEEG